MAPLAAEKAGISVRCDPAHMRGSPSTGTVSGPGSGFRNTARPVTASEYSCPIVAVHLHINIYSNLPSLSVNMESIIPVISIIRNHKVIIL